MAERALCRHAPKVGAECLNWARSDLCGGRGVIPVPTAILRQAMASRQIKSRHRYRLGIMDYRSAATPGIPA